MDKVSHLEVFTKQFQFFGLQCFSLKVFDEKVKIRKPSAAFKILTVLWVVWGTVFASLTLRQYLKSSPPSQNYLDVVIKFINHINYTVSNTFSILTYFQNSRLQNFFWNSTKITELCWIEFNARTDYKKLRKPLAAAIFGYLVYFSILFQDMYPKPDSNLNVYVTQLFWFLIFVFVQMLVFRFFFYVSIVNLHLATMKDLVPLLKFSPHKFIRRKNIIAMRKMFLIIREMVSCINETMGFIIFLRLFMLITSIIKFDYIFIKDIPKAISSLGGVWRKKKLSYDWSTN
jgi:hypothetical protein